MKVLSQTGLAELISKIKAWGAAKFLDKTDVEQTTTIGVDSAPTSGSMNLVTSGGVKTALDGKQSQSITDSAGYFTVDTVEGALAEIGAELAGINTLIGSGVIS